jgi:hypothetical protein
VNQIFLTKTNHIKISRSIETEIDHSIETSRSIETEIDHSIETSRSIETEIDHSIETSRSIEKEISRRVSINNLHQIKKGRDKTIFYNSCNLFKMRISTL